MMRAPFRSTGPRAQRGQAMTEFVVGVVFFLLPLFLIVPMMGKYADVKAASAQSARYAAWERTVWFGGDSASVTWPGNSKSESEIQNEARKRVVEFNTLVKSSNDKTATSFTTGGARNLWSNRDGTALLTTYGGARNGISNEDSPDTITASLLGPITTLTGFLGFSLETKGLYRGTAAIDVTTKPIGTNLGGTGGGSFDPGTMTFTDRNVILANGWSANGRAHVESMTRGVALTGILGSQPEIATILQASTCVAAAFFAPELCMLEWSKVVPDVVPPDRLTD